jgi:glycyl-tRNA synthetase (class II)
MGSWAHHADVAACPLPGAGTSIGKRYARTDELGVPYDITVDGDTTEKDGTVTLRERDTTGQARARAALALFPTPKS